MFYNDRFEWIIAKIYTKHKQKRPKMNKKNRILVRSFQRNEFKVQTFRAGGSGGQNQNKVETGVRIIHIPTGLRAESRVHASQHANRKEAFKVLAIKIKEHYFPDTEKERAPVTDRIRTYHQPQHRVTDHRTGKDYNYEKVVNGNGLEEIIEDVILETTKELSNEK